MQPRDFPPLVEAFLLVEQPRQRFGHWTAALAPLDDGRAPPLAQVVAYYDPSCDQALIGLRYDEIALGRERLAFVVEIALLAEIGMIQPAELSEGDRRRFLGERLAHCTIHVTDQRSVNAALTELVRRIREHKQGAQTLVGQGSSHKMAARATLRPRGDTENPVLLVKARSTRDDLQAPPAAPRTITPRIGSDPLPIEDTDVVQPAGIIYARYLRAGRWVPVRIGALSLRGAALMSGVLPRLGDSTDVSISYAEHRALLRGPVVKVSTPEETAVTGTATFTVAFEHDETSHRELATLLTAARTAQVTIKPAPPRRTRRFLVEWPVCLGTSRGAIRGHALDVSSGGMFVRSPHPLTLHAIVNFSVMLDDGSSPASGRARVVRHVDAEEARTAGLAAGFGLQITEISPSERARWEQFVARVAKRTEKRVLVGAAPERLAELKTALAALGYAVTGGTDPGALVQLAGSDRPVDAVLLDPGWLSPGTSGRWIESLFSARNVPCVTEGDPRRSRLAIDRVLTVV
jgi:hypothetical protein